MTRRVREHRKINGTQPLISGLPEAFDYLRERHITFIPDDIRARVEQVRARRRKPD
jgi:hypothetical protein